MHSYDHDHDTPTADDRPDDDVTEPPQAYFDALLGNGFGW